MSNQDKLKEIVRKLIKKEVEEASTSGATPGYQTPNAFTGGSNKGKKKKKDISTNSTGYNMVNEGITPTGYSAFERILRYMMPYFKDLQKALKKRDDKEVISHVEDIYEYVLTMRGYLKNKKYTESINEFKNMSPGLKRALAQKGYGPIFFTIDQSKKQLKQLKYSRGEILDTLYTMFGKEDPKIVAKIKESVNKVNEGKYHDYRNDETLSPKQKIGRSMREIRDSLTELNKLVKMNVRLKNELNVNSQSYWKNTHKALNKISERLVKLANKVGQLQ